MVLTGYKFSVRHIALLIFCLLGMYLGASAQTQVVLQPSKDNTLYEDATGSLSNGAGTGMFVGRTNASDLIRRGLVAFNIAGNIPATATITGVTLRMTVSQSTSGSREVQLRRALAEWGEGTSVAGGGGGGGAPSTTGDATWIHTFFSSSFWANAGGDFSATVSASQTVGNFGDFTWGSTAQMVSDVQNWLNNPTSNHGWLVLGDETATRTAKRFDTREGTSPPQLTVTYNPTSVEELRGLPDRFVLHQNYPNPFNPSTKIQFGIPPGVSGHATLRIFNMLGQQVALLVDQEATPGNFEATWDATGAASGMYICRLTAGSFSSSTKMLLTR